MDMQIVDLYRHFGITPAQGAQAKLTVWHCATSLRVSAHRTKPAVLILPGGAYAWNSPREAEPVALRYAARGYTPFVLNYSCAPHVFPTALREAAMAMRFIRENAEAYEVNPNMVAAIGFSAGGHLCGTLGTMYDYPEVEHIAPPEVLRPDALGLCYPVAIAWGKTHTDSFRNISGGDAKLAAKLSLDKLVRPDMPPVFLWHTRDDGSVPCRNSLILATALDEAGVDFALKLYRHGPHGVSTADEMAYSADQIPACSWDLPYWLDEQMAFFRECGFAVQDGE